MWCTLVYYGGSVSLCVVPVPLHSSEIILKHTLSFFLFFLKTPSVLYLSDDVLQEKNNSDLTFNCISLGNGFVKAFSSAYAVPVTRRAEKHLHRQFPSYMWLSAGCNMYSECLCAHAGFQRLLPSAPLQVSTNRNMFRLWAVPHPRWLSLYFFLHAHKPPPLKDVGILLS